LYDQRLRIVDASVHSKGETDMEMTKSVRLEIVEESVLRRIARIFGPNSGAASALADLDHYRESGGQAKCFLDRKNSMWVIEKCP
jgi:hypothetical protein